MTSFCVLLTVMMLALRASGLEATQNLSPAQQKSEWARKAIEQNPKRAQPYNQLAWALAHRARETGDPTYYEEAQSALKTSLSLEPNNFEARKIQVWILLGKHEFTEALQQATVLNRQVPDDILVYGYLVDANLELGNYGEAEKAAQWMLDIRPGNVAGLTRAAYLRELFGDIDGAIELMNLAYQRTPPNEVEELAWILTQIAHLQLMMGKVESADQLLQKALQHFPDYHYALAELAKVHLARNKPQEAVELLGRRYRTAPHPENLYDLALALRKAGRAGQAEKTFQEFEKRARDEVELQDNANRELIFYYADDANNPREALRIAEREIRQRRDLYTLDAYAWALCANGRYAEAHEQIQAALAVGVRDAKLFYHAGSISLKNQDRAAAAQYLSQCIELNPVSEFAPLAREALENLRKPSL